MKSFLAQTCPICTDPRAETTPHSHIARSRIRGTHVPPPGCNLSSPQWKKLMEQRSAQAQEAQGYLLDFIRENPGTTSGELRRKLGVSTTRVWNILEKMSQRRLVTSLFARHGNGRTRRWYVHGGEPA